MNGTWRMTLNVALWPLYKHAYMCPHIHMHLHEDVHTCTHTCTYTKKHRDPLQNVVPRIQLLDKAGTGALSKF